MAQSAAIGYLLGTLPSADLVTKRISDGTVDLRASGSGNPGAVNAAQVLGRRAGYQILAADVAKGAAASMAGRALAGGLGAHVGGSSAVIGHCFPVWNGFRGGKGVAASVGHCLATFPAYFPIDLAVAAVTAIVPRWKQRAFAATAVASGCWVIAGGVWWRKQWPNLWGPRSTASLPVSAAVSSAVILYRFAPARPPAPSGGIPESCAA